MFTAALIIITKICWRGAFKHLSTGDNITKLWYVYVMGDMYNIHKKELNFDTCNTDECQPSYAEWKKSDKEEYIVCDSLYMKH